MKISRLKLGKSRQTLICQYQRESGRSESEGSQPGMKSISKPNSFGVKTEPTLSDALGHQPSDTIFINLRLQFSFNPRLQAKLCLNFSSSVEKPKTQGYSNLKNTNDLVKVM